ncbi:MAG: hypothetical protein CL610_20445 [Anaerolineaceae bacterium]|nr:hypothetical protein [Anaerolineaceae bacterium]
MLKRAMLLLLWVAAACAPESVNRPSILDQPRELPTLPPAAWIQPAEPITLETVPNIALLGRLDNPVAPSTIFDHALSPDGTRLAGLDNQQLIVWDLVTGETVFSTGRQEDATRVFFSADKTEAYTVEVSGLVDIYDAETGGTTNTFDGIDQYTGVVDYDAEAGWLALGNSAGMVKVWDPMERQALATFQAHDQAVSRLVFSDNGDWLATADPSGEVRVWDWRAQTEVASIANGLPALALAFAPDDSLLAVGTRQDIRLWTLPDAALQHTLPTGEGATEIMLFSPDGTYLVNGGETPDMQVWQVQDGASVARLPDVGQDRLSATFSPDGDLLLTSELGGDVSLWNMTTITESSVNRANLDTRSNFVYAVNWTEDGLLINLFGATGSVYVWGVPPFAE